MVAVVDGLRRGQDGYTNRMNVEIWSDIVCPWCYIGKRRFEAAAADFAHRDEVSVTWRSFELDPSAPASAPGDPVDRLAAKYGMSRADAQAAQARVTANAATEGLDFHLDRARSGNTFDAHRLLHHALPAGRQAELKERLMAAYFVEGQAVGEREVLVQLATEVGLDEATVREVLATGAFADAVRHDEHEARELRITGVPFFVIDRAYGIAGAQPAELIASALARAWADSHPLQMVPVGGDTGVECTDDSCAV
jgi:predicted DsbA family dithiol-disulfide isomerase